MDMKFLKTIGSDTLRKGLLGSSWVSVPEWIHRPQCKDHCSIEDRRASVPCASHALICEEIKWSEGKNVNVNVNVNMLVCSSCKHVR